MNILLFARLFYPHIGGVEKHVLEIGKILTAKGHRVIVITEKFDKKIPMREKTEGIEVYRIVVGKDNWFKKFRIWRELWKHKNLIKTADIIHCHDVFFWYLPFRFLFPFKKVFTTFHGYEDYPLKFKSIIIRKISEILSFGNICVGSFIKKWYGTKPTYTTYGGVNIVKSKKLKVKSLEGAIFIGRLDEQTGILNYINAVKLIRRKIPNFNFLIIGNGKLKKKINRKIKILNAFKGASKYLKEYNFVFASGYLSILEAVSAKRLVFAVYDNPLKEDYLKLTPFSKFISISSSPSELASKAIYYLNNKDEQDRITAKAYKWVKKYTWEEVVNTYLKLWKL